MKRAVLLILFAGAPLVLALFPRLRRALVRKARLVLLLYAGAVLMTAFAVGFWSNRAASLSEGEIALAAAGAALVLVAFGAVVRDALRDRSTRG
jgi:hypothetical protein